MLVCRAEALSHILLLFLHLFLSHIPVSASSIKNLLCRQKKTSNLHPIAHCSIPFFLKVVSVLSRSRLRGSSHPTELNSSHRLGYTSTRACTLLAHADRVACLS